MVSLANSWYGHRRVVVRYAVGNQPVNRVLADIQHGWTTLPQMSLGGRGLGYPFVTRLVWGTEQGVRVRNAGTPNVVVAGSPWGYLMRLLADGSATNSETRSVRPSETGTIAYPFHAAANYLTDDFHEHYALQLRETEDGEVTVVLHPVDAFNKLVSDAYLAQGHQVVSHGADKYDELFLIRQFQMLSMHGRVVANRLSTAVWYGVERGLEPALYGPESSLRGKPGVSLHFPVQERDTYREPYAPLYRGAPLDLWRRQCRLELGLDHLREPADLAELLGLSGPRRAARVLYSSAAGLRLATWHRPHDRDGSHAGLRRFRPTADG